jgi:hypothetical protein
MRVRERVRADGMMVLLAVRAIPVVVLCYWWLVISDGDCCDSSVKSAWLPVFACFQVPVGTTGSSHT